MPLVIAREVSPSLARCELTHLGRQPIDLKAARAQHREYLEALSGLGCGITVLPAEPELPDSVFVEDTALVLEELAVITRPGAPSRRAETDSIRAALAPYRELVEIEPPGTLDGGDILRIERELYVGRSSRSNAQGIEELRALVAPAGYTVSGVELSGCLHLKSAVSLVAPGTLLIQPEWVSPEVFARWRRIEIDPAEPFAANALLVEGCVVHPRGFDGTRERLEAAGIRVLPVETGELQKAEGGVTCCSLVVA